MKIFCILFSYLMLSIPAAAAEPRFVDAETYFSTTEMGRLLLPSGFKAMKEKFDRQFDSVCGDSFCEGVVSNWAPLDLICTIDQGSHVVGECIWSFAGSFEEIDENTGKVAVFHENRTCDLGIHGPTGRFAEFLLAASVSDEHALGMLTVRVPGRTDDQTLFDVLNACL